MERFECAGEVHVVVVEEAQMRAFGCRHPFFALRVAVACAVWRAGQESGFVSPGDPAGLVDVPGCVRDDDDLVAALGGGEGLVEGGAA